jgi:hypothetical protein
MQYPSDELRLDPSAVSPNQSGVTTAPIDGVSVILTETKIFQVFNLNIFFTRYFAPVLVGFDSQLTLKLFLSDF